MTYLLDTNLLVYPYDVRDEAKQARARALLERLALDDTASLSSQALAEFSNVGLKKLRLTPTFMIRQVERYTQLFQVIPLTSAVVLEAVRGVGEHTMSYYDAQVWAAAKLNQVPVVLSEDFPNGATVEGVTFLNPLEADFDLGELS